MTTFIITLLLNIQNLITPDLVESTIDGSLSLIILLSLVYGAKKLNTDYKEVA